MPLPGSVESAQEWAAALTVTGERLLEEGFDEAAADVYCAAGELLTWSERHA